MVGGINSFIFIAFDFYTFFLLRFVVKLCLLCLQVAFQCCREPIIITAKQICLLQDDVQLWLSHVAFCKKWVCKIISHVKWLHNDAVMDYFCVFFFPIRPPKDSSARCTQLCSLSTLTNQVVHSLKHKSPKT